MEEVRFDAVLGITTFNRVPYLRRCVESFFDTRNSGWRWLLLVADDGSSDGTLSFLRSVRLPPKVEMVVLKGNRDGVATQTNRILLKAMREGFNIGFKVDDDISFQRPGWDDEYLDAIKTLGLDHLVFFSTDYRSPSLSVERANLIARTNAAGSMGAFWTFTERLIRTIGFLDAEEFPIRGHAHIDFSTRACRAGFNRQDTLFDLQNSAHLLKLADLETYIPTFDWKSLAVKTYFSSKERERRVRVIEDPRRLYVPYNESPTKIPTRFVRTYK